jgi:hypothetical protein
MAKLVLMCLTTVLVATSVAAYKRKKVHGRSITNKTRECFSTQMITSTSGKRNRALRVSQENQVSGVHRVAAGNPARRGLQGVEETGDLMEPPDYLDEMVM